MKNKNLLSLLAIVIIVISFSGCAKSDDSEVSLEQKIIGKWKLITQEENIDGVLHTTDYTYENDETTHHYFKDGTMIFYEWGETFQYTYMISGDFLYHLKNGDIDHDYKIISLSNSELVMDLLDNNDSSRIRHYEKVYD